MPRLPFAPSHRSVCAAIDALCDELSALIFVIRKYLFVPAFGAHLPGEDAFGTSSLLTREQGRYAEEENED